jgi:hypothetical protein
VTWHRVESLHSVVGVLTETTDDGSAAAADRLLRRYRTVPGLQDWGTSRLFVPAAAAALVVAGPRPPRLAPGDGVVWGRAVGRAGQATPAELDRALAEPVAAQELDGVFVLVRADADGLGILTSSAFVFTLRRSGPAFATRAVAALALAGRALAVERQAVPEAVVWGAVTHEGDLLRDVTACPEATEVRVTRAVTSVRSYADLGTRIPPGAPPDVTAFRAEVGRVAGRFAAVEAAQLSLTGGRDSAMVASCLAERGTSLPAFTMGPARYDDVRAAKAVAHELGWPHVTLPVTDARGRAGRLRPARSAVPGGQLADWLVAHAPWCEGLQHPRDALVGWLPPRGPGIPAVSGHSGEVGRAFYWEGASDSELDHDPVSVVTGRGTARHLPAPARAAFAHVVERSVRDAADVGRPRAALDVLYVQRQRSWLHHKWLPRAPVADVLPVFLVPGTVRQLLDVPREQQRGGAFFDAALDAYRPELRTVALREAGRSLRGWRLLGPLNPYLLRDDGPLLSLVLRQLAPGGMLVRDVLGSTWWEGALEAARRSPAARAPIWNAVGIEALHRVA